MGRNARALAEREFDRDVLAERALAVLEEAAGAVSDIELSYCVVNTNGREDLLACLDAIASAPIPTGVSHEVLVLDNASDDGSADAVRERHPEARLIALDRRAGKAANDSRLLQEARGRYCLLLNEDAELREGGGGGAARGPRRRTPVPPQPAPGCSRARASRPPAPGACRISPGRSRRRYSCTRGWPSRAVATRCARSAGRSRARCSSGARRRSRSDWLDPDFFVYSDETDFCKRLHDAGWRILFVPAARAVHHDQLCTDRAAMSRRIVEFHRNRDLYFRKHGMGLTRLVWRACWTWAYLVRAAAALVVPGRDPRRYLLHARQELAPGRGKGIREAAEEHNARLDAPAARAERTRWARLYASPPDGAPRPRPAGRGRRRRRGGACAARARAVRAPARARRAGPRRGRTRLFARHRLARQARQRHRYRRRRGRDPRARGRRGAARPPAGDRAGGGARGGALPATALVRQRRHLPRVDRRRRAPRPPAPALLRAGRRRGRARLARPARPRGARRFHS